MKLTDFSKAYRRWDSYNAFHTYVGNNNFVQFETGELMTTSTRWTPSDRMVYSELNVEVITPRDSKYKYKLPDGRIVPKAWLMAEGSPNLLVDLDTKHTVSLSRDWKKTEERPDHLRRAVAWFYSAKSKPQSTSTITISEPRKLETVERKWIRDLRKLCNVFVKLNEQNNQCWDNYQFDYKDLLTLVADGKSPAQAFGELNEYARARIARNGVSAGRVVFDVPYVEVV